MKLKYLGTAAAEGIPACAVRIDLSDGHWKGRQHLLRRVYRRCAGGNDLRYGIRA